MSRQRFIANPWLLGLIGVALVAVLLWLAIPSVYVGLVPPGPRGKMTVGLNGCRQLHMAFQQYFLDQATTDSPDRSPPTVSKLVEEGYFDQSFIDSLAKNRGVYFIYIPTEAQSKGVSIQYFSEYGTAQVDAAGDGSFEVKR